MVSLSPKNLIWLDDKLVPNIKRWLKNDRINAIKPNPSTPNKIVHKKGGLNGKSHNFLMGGEVMMRSKLDIKKKNTNIKRGLNYFSPMLPIK
jgi:hypothetical protein